MKMNKFIVTFLCVMLVTGWAQGQCVEPDASIWDNPWQSCEVKQCPNRNRADGHWIMYDFGEMRRISKMHVWNINETSIVNHGFKSVSVDFSSNGRHWTELGTYSWPMASGSNIYGGFEGADFAGESARYVLLYAHENWGGACSGLTEVKFNLMRNNDDALTEFFSAMEDEDALLIYPNPARDQASLVFQSATQGEGYIQVFNFLGQRVFGADLEVFEGPNRYTLPVEGWASQIYVVSVHVHVDQEPLVGKLVVNR
ncbi:T9SS type A sorting domain-containing protein [Cryomorphaceae bacterium]|nr:T9SS type A sorting domain-containing protein [Cryomorphaceae bacterium]